MSTYWLDRIKNGAIYVTVSVLVVGALGYLVLRRTTSNKTIVQAGGTKVDYWSGAQVKPGFGGCVTIKADKAPNGKD